MTMLQKQSVHFLAANAERHQSSAIFATHRFGKGIVKCVSDAAGISLAYDPASPAVSPIAGNLRRSAEEHRMQPTIIYDSQRPFLHCQSRSRTI